MESRLVYTIITASVGAVSLSYLTYYYFNRRKLQHPPKNAKWQYIGTVQEIAIYPIRSGAANLLNEVQCMKDGLYSDDIKDRGLYLIDNKGKFAWAGVYPKMLSIKTELKDTNILEIKFRDMASLKINLEKLKIKEPIIKQRKKYKMHLVEGEPEHHEWFSKAVLNKSEGYKLYLCVKVEYEYNLMGEDKSQYIPVMVMHNKSINDLNQRLSANNQANHLQFRGNVLIDSDNNIKPYAEDNWSWLCIGQPKENDNENCILRYQAPCLRCILPNVDIETCKRNPNFEPLKTLKKYRLIHDSKEPTLGAHYKVYREGTIKANDPVYAIVSS